MIYLGKKFVRTYHPEARLKGFADECWIEWDDADNIAGVYESSSESSPESAWHQAALEVEAEGEETK